MNYIFTKQSCSYNNRIPSTQKLLDFPDIENLLNKKIFSKVNNYIGKGSYRRFYNQFRFHEYRISEIINPNKDSPVNNYTEDILDTAIEQNYIPKFTQFRTKPPGLNVIVTDFRNMILAIRTVNSAKGYVNGIIGGYTRPDLQISNLNRMIDNIQEFNSICEKGILPLFNIMNHVFNIRLFDKTNYDTCDISSEIFYQILHKNLIGNIKLEFNWKILNSNLIYMMELLDKSLITIFSNKTYQSIINMFLILYAGLAAPKLPKSIKKIFKNQLFRLIFFTLILYQSNKNTTMSILLAICFAISLQNNHIIIKEKFSNNIYISGYGTLSLSNLNRNFVNSVNYNNYKKEFFLNNSGYNNLRYSFFGKYFKDFKS